jgi:PAS domain S-box-containing protein
VRGEDSVAQFDQTETPYAWVEATPQPVAVTEQSGSILALNVAFAKLLTIDRARLPSEAIEDVILPSRLRSAYRAARQTALNTGWSPVAGHINEFTAVRADGSEFPVELSISRTSEDPHPTSRPGFETRPRTGRSSHRHCGERPSIRRQRSSLGSGAGNGGPRLGGCCGQTECFGIFGLRPAFAVRPFALS